MGRINLTPLRVRQRALQNLESRRTNVRPLWLEVVGDIPPAQIYVREQPQMHPLTKVRTKRLPPPPDASPSLEDRDLPTRVEVEVTKPKKVKKRASKLFQPVQIRYEEDDLRRQFFNDHPWELARPRIVLETDGRDTERQDWSKRLEEQRYVADGEAAVQRQLHLLQNVPDITVSEAYDVARKEFYNVRFVEETRRRVAAEEAQAVDAQFGTSMLQVGVQLENKHYDGWEAWSRRMVTELAQRNAAFAGETGGTNAQQDDMLQVATNDKRIGASVFSEQDKKGFEDRAVLE